MVVVLARSPRAAAASRGGSARPAWLGVAFILMRGLFWGGGGCPDTELRLLADKVMGGAVRGSTSVRAFTSSTTSTSPCFSSSSPSSHLLQLLLVGSIRALACACGFGLWDTPRGAGFQARGGLAVFTRRGRGALLHDQYTFTNDSFSTSIELRLAISYPGMLSEAPCRRCGCGKIGHVNGYFSGRAATSPPPPHLPPPLPPSSLAGWPWWLLPLPPRPPSSLARRPLPLPPPTPLPYLLG